MKLKIALILVVTFSPLLMALPALQIYHPEKLKTLLEQSEASVKKGEKPQVVFDIDDTLTLSNSRTLLILREFAMLEKTKTDFPAPAKRLSSIGLSDMRYSLKTTIYDYGVLDPDLLQVAEPFWKERFFGDDYCSADIEVAGAAAYIKELHKVGVRIVYLTGRPLPAMSQCTQKSLTSLGFPQDANTELLMKPDPKQSDLDFKKEAFVKINKIGKVIAAFENEPQNLNAFGKAFPEATLYFLDTSHSTDPTRPEPTSVWLRDFKFEK